MWFGSQFVVGGAVNTAQWMGVPSGVVGLTVIALGTSLPELASTTTASLMGDNDMAAGNVVGSNIFNLLLVLGIPALVLPRGISVTNSMLAFDWPIMLAASFACLPILFTGFQIARWEGAVFVGYYAAYAGYLYVRTADYEALTVYSSVMFGYVLPLTLLTFLVLIIQETRTLDQST